MDARPRRPHNGIELPTVIPVVPLAVPQLIGNERAYVEECIESGYVSSVGPFVDRFEREFAAYVGAEHAVACVNGTAALHVALRLSGASGDGYVALSTFTFIASANAASYTGARPYLVDSEPVTWNLNAEALHDEVVRRAHQGQALPQAVEVVHVLGHPAQLEPLLALRDTYGIPIIEDAAEALGAGWTDGPLAGRHVGSAGEFGCFSFNGNKVITTGGGGMIVTNDPEMASRARHLTTQAKTSRRGYLHDEVGYNYRLTNVAAALGVAQLEQLPAFLDRKRHIAATYNAELRDLPVTLPPSVSWAASSSWLYSILLPEHVNLEGVLDKLEERGVQARPLWPPLHRQQPYLSVEVLGGAVADDLYARGLSLPCSVGMTDHDQQRVIEELRAALR